MKVYSAGEDVPSWLLCVQILASLWALAVAPAALLLLIVAEFPRSRLCAVAVLVAAVLPFLVTLTFGRRRSFWMRISALAFTVGLVAGVTALIAAPTREPSDGRVFEYHAKGSEPFDRFSYANIVPELDQLRVVFTLTPAIDRLFTWQQAAALKRMTTEVYWEMAGDQEFRELGSAMPAVHAEILGRPEGITHCFVYVPENLRRAERAPLIVFFHGSGGNFKGYLWILSQVADRAGCILVAPTGGMGNWKREASRAAFALALEAAGSRARIDREQIHIVGLSNGGMALSHLLATPDARVRSVAAISPVFADAAVDAEVAGAPRVLVITGANDDRVPLSYVQSRTEYFRRSGFAATLAVIPAADHFLFFSQRRAVVTRLTDWIRETVPGDVRRRELR